MRKSFLTFLATILLCAPSLAADYTVCDGNVKSFALPIYMGNTTSAAGSFYGSITQQIYLAEELSSQGVSSGDITAVTFYYTAKDGTAGEVAGITRNIAIYLMEVDASVDEYEIEEFAKYVGNTYKSYFLCDANNKAGTKVYDGNLSTSAVTTENVLPVKLDFSSSFAWSGTKNIVMTVVDKTASSQSSINLRFLIASTKTDAGVTSHPRFLDTYWTISSDERASWITNGNYNFSGKLGEIYGQDNSVQNTASEQASRRSYAAKVTFSITTPIPAPTNLAASSITTSSATLSWDAVDGASSYNVRWGKTSGSLDNSGNVATNSIDISGLEDGETYYFDVQTVKAAGSSAYASEANFTTTAVTHIHDGITFSKWSSTSSLPAAAGNYYLSNDVTLEADYTVPGNINLCLNGHDIYTYAYYITVPDNKTLALYDNVGGGRIYGYYAVELAYSNNGLITIDADGTLVLNGVSVENLANNFNSGEAAYGIYNIGTLKISGAPVISGDGADIYLYDGKVITIESGKPLTNTTPYRILRGNTGDITSGWANMNGANPSDYLTSAPPARGVCLNSATGEARFVRNLRINESNDNDNISDPAYASQLINVSMTRSLTSSQYNTFCLPFALSDAQLQLYFGAGYDLEEFVSSELDGDLLSLTFSKVTSLTAGKPYLLKPAIDVANPTFEAVTLGATSPVDQTSDTYISFIGTFAPTELAGGNKNILFLGADNELFWPASTGNLKGFRAYFEVKGAAQKAAKRARIVQQPGTATGIENQMVNGKCENGKFIKDGQLFIIRDGKTYNILGIECK